MKLKHITGLILTIKDFVKRANELRNGFQVEVFVGYDKIFDQYLTSATVTTTEGHMQLIALTFNAPHIFVC